LSVTRPFDSSSALYYKRSIVTMQLSCTVMEIWCLKDNGVTNLTVWGHVTSSVTWPFDSRGSTSYGWSVVTMRPSGTVTEMWRLKYWTHGRGHGKNKKYEL